MFVPLVQALMFGFLSHLVRAKLIPLPSAPFGSNAERSIDTSFGLFVHPLVPFGTGVDDGGEEVNGGNQGIVTLGGTVSILIT